MVYLIRSAIGTSFLLSYMEQPNNPTGEIACRVFYCVFLDYSLMAQLKSVPFKLLFDLWNGSK